MDETHITAFGRLLDVMARIYNKSLDRDDKAAYLMAVDDLSFEAIQYACKQIFRQETFMPVPSIIRSYAKEWTQAHHGLLPTQSAEQVLALREALMPSDEVQALIASIGLWPEEAPPHPLPHQRHWDPDALRYEPTTNPDEAKRKARAQLEALEARSQDAQGVEGDGHAAD